MSNLVPEIIRWQTPLPYMRRTANRDCEIRDKQILKGDQILMWYLSANRDEDVFDDAEAIDLDATTPTVTSRSGTASTTAWAADSPSSSSASCGRRSSSGSTASRSRTNPARTFSSFVHGYTSLPVTVTRR